MKFGSYVYVDIEDHIFTKKKNQNLYLTIFYSMELDYSSGGSIDSVTSSHTSLDRFHYL